MPSSHRTRVQLFTTASIQAINNKLKELEEDVQEGFTSLRCSIDDFKNQTRSSMQEWERKHGLSLSSLDL